MKTRVKVTLVLTFIAIAAVFLVFRFVLYKPHPDYEKLPPAWSMDAGSFYREYKTNTDHANKLYIGKVIGLTGKLTRVETPDTLTIAVFAFEQDLFGGKGIRCTMLRKFSPDAEKLKPGGIIRIKGYCSGYNGTDVVMEQCSIIY